MEGFRRRKRSNSSSRPPQLNRKTGLAMGTSCGKASPASVGTVPAPFAVLPGAGVAWCAAGHARSCVSDLLVYPHSTVSDPMLIGATPPTPRPNHCREEQEQEAKRLLSVQEEGIVVFIRARPMSEKEQREGANTFMNFQSPTQLYIPASDATAAEKTLSFDAVLPEDQTQQQVFEVAGLSLIRKALMGYNATMFAYGQTGSGKTFTMEGTAQEPGLVPRICSRLFDEIQAKEAVDVTVMASYVEIFQETIRDLLDSGVRSPGPSPSSDVCRKSVGTSGASVASDGAGVTRPHIREAKDGSIYLDNAVEEKVDNGGHILGLLARGLKRRAKGETAMNEASSRSHAVLTLTLTQIEKGDVDGVTAINSKMSLIDLAGSERAKSTGAEGERLKEGAKINQSLSALGNVINALTAASLAEGGRHVPYRDSKLTRLLQDSLGGTAYTVVCCNVSPASTNEAETVSTLRFAERLKKVKNQMVVHVDPKTKKILELRGENQRLRNRVLQLEALPKEGGLMPNDSTTSTSTQPPPPQAQGDDALGGGGEGNGPLVTEAPPVLVRPAAATDTGAAGAG